DRRAGVRRTAGCGHDAARHDEIPRRSAGGDDGPDEGGAPDSDRVQGPGHAVIRPGLLHSSYWLSSQTNPSSRPSIRLPAVAVRLGSFRQVTRTTPVVVSGVVT